MPLEILAGMVIIGIAAVTVAVRLSGMSHPYRLIGEPDARAAFASRFPDDKPEEIILAGDGSVAFLRLPSGRTGLVAAFGARYVCRVFGPGETRLVKQDGRGGIRLRFRDFGFPGGQYRFNNPIDARKVTEWLGVARDARFNS